MLAYQAGIAKFAGVGSKVFAISTDNTPSLKAFSTQVKATFPMLSDFTDRHVARAYGILIAPLGLANRATFVVDRAGRIQSIEEGSAALDPTGAEKSCSLLVQKK
jgi:peroxiredoxin